MADQSEYDIIGTGQTQEPVLDKNLPGYRYAKALCEAARAEASKKTKTFRTKWEYFLGLNHWRPPASTAATKLDEWAFRGVVNYTYATVKTKAAQILNAEADTVVEALDDHSTYRDRQLWKAAIDQELSRLEFKTVAEDVFLRGAVTYVGVFMVTAKPDPLTGAMAISLKSIDPADFYCDPSADSITDPACRFVVWEPELDMSTVREMWHEKASKVKAESKALAYEKSGITYSATGDANLIYGSAGDYLVDGAGILKSRKARVQFVWIKDESLVEDIAVAQNAGTPPPEGTPDMMVSRKYPYGRLIVYSGETLLYDGENPYELENVFPFSVYHHDRIPGSFYGTCDPDLLQSLQEAQDTSIGQLIDYVRLCVNGPFVYPISFKSLTALGNAPGERHPGPDNAPWQPHYVTPEGFNVQAWTALTGAIEHHFGVVSGITQLGLGQTSSPPISATEAEIANARLSDRMKGYSERLARSMSGCAEIIREMMIQFYQTPRTVPVTMPDSEIKSTIIDVQSLPAVRVKVVISHEEAIKDKLIGQNLAQGIPTGVLDSPHAQLFLESIGTPPNRIREIMENQNLQAELVPPGAGGPPPGMGPAPLSLVGGPQGPPPPGGM